MQQTVDIDVEVPFCEEFHDTAGSRVLRVSFSPFLHFEYVKSIVSSTTTVRYLTIYIAQYLGPTSIFQEGSDSTDLICVKPTSPYRYFLSVAIFFLSVFVFYGDTVYVFGEKSIRSV